MGRVWNGIKRGGLALATGGGSEVYRATYGKAAEDQKKGADAAAASLDDLRTTNQERYKGARSNVDTSLQAPAWAISDYSRNAPTQLNDLYKRTPQTRAPGRRTAYTGQGPRTLNDLYDNNEIGKIGGATDARSAAFDRVGPTDVENRYGASGGREREADSNLAGFESTLMDPAGRPISDRLTERRNAPTGPGTSYFGMRQSGGTGGALATESFAPEVGRNAGRMIGDASAMVDQFDAGGRMRKFSDLYNPTEEGMIETFAKGALEGGEADPHFNRLADDLSKRTQRAAAARGNFNSGAGIKQERDAMLDFDTQRYMRLADLAERGDRAKLDRLGLGFGMERDIDAAGVQKLGLGVDVKKEGARAATAADDTKAGLYSDADATRTERTGQLDKLAGLASDEAMEKGRALDTLSGDLDESQGRRERLRFDTASGRDKTRQDERKMLDDLARDSSTFSQNREFEKNRMAGEVDKFTGDRVGRRLDYGTAASDEAAGNLERDIGIAGEEDKADERYRDFIAGLAKDSSEEGRQTLKDIADLQLRLGEIRANLGKDLDMASIDDDTRLAIEQINIRLGRAGIDGAQRQAFINDLLSVAGTAAKLKGG